MQSIAFSCSSLRSFNFLLVTCLSAKNTEKDTTAVTTPAVVAAIPAAVKAKLAPAVTGAERLKDY